MDPETEEPLDAEEIREMPTTRGAVAKIDDVDAKSRTIVVTFNTDQVDEWDTVILPKGGDFTAYMRNPVFLWCHNSELPPLGRSLWTALREKKTRCKAKIQFDTDPFSELIFSKYESGSMNGVSLRFDPIWEEVGGPSPEELKERPDWKKARIIYRKWKLKEISAVPLMGNVDCLVEAVQRGAIAYLPDNVREACERIGKAAMPPAPTPEPEPAQDKPKLPSLAGAVTLRTMTAALTARVAQIKPDQLIRDTTRAALDRHRGVI